jgi:hypothetical protein
MPRHRLVLTRFRKFSSSREKMDRCCNHQIASEVTLAVPALAENLIDLIPHMLAA